MDGRSLVTEIVALAQTSHSLIEYRRQVLTLLGSALGFDAALFHELSPRVPLSRAAMLGLDPRRISASRKSWDAFAVALGRMRDLALEQGGVVTDRDALPPRSRARKTFEVHVARPLGIRTLLMVHLTFDERIVSAIMLFRRGGARFSQHEQLCIRELVPALTLGDVVHQLATRRPLRGAATRIRCMDQRLTPRQRELVEHVALGHTNLNIAAALGISPNTVRNMLTVVRRKLDAANRAELVRVAVLR